MVPSQKTEQSNMKGIQDDSLVAPCTGKQGQLPWTRHAWGRQAAGKPPTQIDPPKAALNIYI